MDFHQWPKAELHLHLDGSVRPRTVLELALKDGVPLPSSDLQLLRASLVAPDDCPSLVAYIRYFELPIAVMQTADALERVTRELCQDLARDGVRYAEIRYAPWLHVERGLSPSDVIAATLAGWRAGRQAHGLEGGILVRRKCGHGLQVVAPGDSKNKKRTWSISNFGLNRGTPSRAAPCFA